MNKKELVDAIINGNLGWSEGDREKLMELTDNQVQSIHKGLTPPAPAKEESKSSTTTNTAPPATAKEEPKAPTNVITVEGFIANAPTEIQEVLRNGLAAANAEKSAAIQAIKGNPQNPFSDEDLNGMPLGQLKGLARLAAAPPTAAQKAAPSYAGQAPVPVGNTSAQEPMDLPVLNFDKK